MRRRRLFHERQPAKRAGKILCRERVAVREIHITAQLQLRVAGRLPRLSIRPVLQITARTALANTPRIFTPEFGIPPQTPRLYAGNKFEREKCTPKALGL